MIRIQTHRGRKRHVLIATMFISAFLLGAAMLFLIVPPAPLASHVTADSIVVEKSAHRMSLFKDGQVLRTYSVALGRGGSEPKSREGDARTPEGSYVIDRRNPHSCCHLALHINYPNAADVAAARVRSVKAGSDIEIHGLVRGLGWLGTWHRAFGDWTDGCIAVSNREMDEIWRAVPDGTPIVIRH
jgi:murein L,D-transpeptidase YafK